MMRSMFSGVSGLRAHQTRMDVIGNNIANVNTVGFKSGRVTFQEIFSQTLRGAGAPDTTTGRGGTNPMQVGLGLGIASVDTLMTRGSVQRTDNPTDLAIEGEGFFIVKGGNGDTVRFTRAGSFQVDKQGYLVNSNGMNVQGWMDYDTETKIFKTEGDLESINIFEGGPIKNKRVIPPAVTENASYSGNINSKAISLDEYNNPEAPATAPTTPLVLDGDLGEARNAMKTLENERIGSTLKAPMTVYDKLGNEYIVNVCFVKNIVDSDTNESTWTWFVDNPDEADATEMDSISGTIVFEKDGAIKPENSKGSITIQPTSGNTDAFTVELDFSNVSSFASDNSAKPTKVDGYPTGTIVTFNIGADGIITGIYSNGLQQPLGMVGLASFDNPAGLQKTGENLFVSTPNSGEYRKVKPGPGVGTLNPGTLEMSNVDLSREFTEMIVTQRGFQANSRIITTSDEMLQELVNLKR